MALQITQDNLAALPSRDALWAHKSVLLAQHILRPKWGRDHSAQNPGVARVSCSVMNQSPTVGQHTLYMSSASVGAEMAQQKMTMRIILEVSSPCPIRHYFSLFCAMGFNCRIHSAPKRFICVGSWLLGLTSWPDRIVHGMAPKPVEPQREHAPPLRYPVRN